MSGRFHFGVDGHGRGVPGGHPTEQRYTRSEYAALRRRALLVTTGMIAVLALVASWVFSQARSTGSPVLWVLFVGSVVALLLGVRALAAVLRRTSPPDHT
jgi:hypothetical protein